MNEKKNKIKLFKEKSKILKENKNLNDMGASMKNKTQKRRNSDVKCNSDLNHLVFIFNSIVACK